MTEKTAKKPRYNGRIAQTAIYVGKFFRMFVYQSDWKVLPIGAVIAAIVTFVTGTYMFVTQEGTTTGTFALTCACVWNGFFNSIQGVCREREIVKREHRAGLHVSAYIAAHMLYQLFLCFMQTLVTIGILRVANIQIPAKGVITPWGIVDVGITILLVTYAADMMALKVSCVVRTTTAAMTAMPFLLIFQLVFSGGFFDLAGPAEKVKYATISHWGMDALSAIGRFNEQPMVTLWNTLVTFKNVEVYGERPLLKILIETEQRGSREEFLRWSGSYTMKTAYEATISNVASYWLALLFLLLLFAVVAVIALKFIDRDKR